MKLQTLGSFNVRESDGTHFSEEGLKKMADSVFLALTNNSYGAFTRSPVTATPPPILNLTPSGSSYTASLSAPSGVSYSKFQWESHFGMAWNSYDQSTGTTTNSYSPTNAVSGFVKDNIGRIHMIPYAKVSGASARINNNDTPVVYPNILRVDDNFLNIRLNLDESQKVSVYIFDEKGEKIHELIP